MVGVAIDASVLALLTAILWGLSPVVVKRGLERGGSTVQATMVIIMMTGGLAWTAMFATEGTSAFRGFSTFDFGVFLLGGIVGTTVGRLSNFAGVRRVGASIATAAMNTRPLFAVILAMVFLDESVAVITILGVILIVCGVILLSLARGGDIRGWRTVDLAFPIAAGIAYASGNVIRRYGFLETPASAFEAVAINEFAAFFTLGIYLLAFRRDEIRSAERASIQYFVVAGLISGMGLISLFHALSIGLVSIVDPITGMAPLFAVLFTFLLLRKVERVTGGVIIGAIIIVTGGALVAL